MSSRAFLRLTPIFLLLILSGCADIQKPKIQDYYSAKIEAPQKQEFRWSNGKLPKQLDPALASAPPETDLVRAVYEGLTDLDAKTLKVQPAIAESWDVSPDGRTWTFHLRRSAQWTNGDAVTAKDFARSWRRLAEMGTDVPHSSLLKNIVGAENFSINDGIAILPEEEFEVAMPATRSPIFNSNQAPEPTPPVMPQPGKLLPEIEVRNSPSEPKPTPTPKPPAKPTVQKWFGVEAVNDATLRVFLIQPDKDFPSVVAHPVFRPIHEGAENIDTLANAPKAITNGAFKVATVGKDEVVLQRSENYWDAANVGLETARLIAKPDGESALAAYRSNEIDAVTNTHFEPLALKLLTPFQDFKRTTHNAVTFYEFNTDKKPFNDIRVRQALAMALERDRLVQDEMDSAGEPALDYLPFEDNEDHEVKEGIGDAKRLLAEAGYADASTFPKIRLLINRNDLQRRIARSVQKMWLKNLGIQSEIIIKDRAEYETAINEGDYDLVRRGVVMPTANETVSMLSMFDEIDEDPPLTDNTPVIQSSPSPNTSGIQKMPPDTAVTAGPVRGSGTTIDAKPSQRIVILTEQQAMERLPAIPLYFPISYSLVKPYISGFDANMLDAPSLKKVVIDNQWKNTQASK